MSVEIVISLICDGCGKRITPEPGYKTTVWFVPLTEAKGLAIADGWICVNRGRYNTKAHYCRDCADKPQKPIPKPKRKGIPLDSKIMAINHTDF